MITGSQGKERAVPNPPADRGPEVVVELLGDVAGQLEVLLLVLAGHVRRDRPDVGRHQTG
jgi:hypothetical protein